ncbi:hypothetical protein BDZ89DRAFT_1047374, partial [Hymenopellis radicata]
EREGLNEVGAINLNDAEQHARIVSLFRYCHAVIDFYLSDVVFPRRRSNSRTSCPRSAWDLGERKPHVTTGFSGTKDNEYLLPTSISQVDPVNQLERTPCDTGKSLSGTAFVDMLATEPYRAIRVLLDIGAQMLDLSNQGVAKRWLSKRSDVEAVVFLQQNGRTNGTQTRWNEGVAQLFAVQAAPPQCLVYLDDAHTRGTDLKLPLHWKAAVTLGRKMHANAPTRRGQSLHFFAQPDIDILIKKTCTVDSITVADIVQWTMLETCADIEHHAPQWARQGSISSRERTCLDALPAAPTPEDIQQLRDVWLQPEARPLLEMYGDSQSMSQAESTIQNDLEIYSHLQRLGVLSSAPQNVDEEQEREVDHEMEVERQVERPPPVSSAKHRLHDDVKEFLQSFKRFLPSQLLVTRDYAVTVKGMNTFDKGSVEFLKDVQWLLCATGPPPVVVSHVLLRPEPFATVVQGIHSSTQHLRRQLYPTSYADFKAVSAFLGIVAQKTSMSLVSEMGCEAEDRGGGMEICPFVVSPLALLQELLATRRRGQGYTLTPMGKLVRGLSLGYEEIE